MSPRDWQIRIRDILECIRRIEIYTSGLTFDQFQLDQKTIDAVLRNLEIIGEAARFIPDEVEEDNSHIPWMKIRGFRNIVAHEYFGVSLSIVWETVLNDLPGLAIELQKLSI
jgi:uncharacterized protein with HEPN domain